MDIPPSIIHSGKLIQSLPLFPELSLCLLFLDYNFTCNAFEIYHKFKMQNFRLSKITMPFFAQDTDISIIHVSK